MAVPPARSRSLDHTTAKLVTESERSRLNRASRRRGGAQEVSRYMGVPLSPVTIKRFADGEIYVQINESIRGCDVFIIQVRG